MLVPFSVGGQQFYFQHNTQFVYTCSEHNWNWGPGTYLHIEIIGQGHGIDLRAGYVETLTNDAVLFPGATDYYRIFCNNGIVVRIKHRSDTYFSLILYCTSGPRWNPLRLPVSCELWFWAWHNYIHPVRPPLLFLCKGGKTRIVTNAIVKSVDLHIFLMCLKFLCKNKQTFELWKEI